MYSEALALGPLKLPGEREPRDSVRARRRRRPGGEVTIRHTPAVKVENRQSAQSAKVFPTHWTLGCKKLKNNSAFEHHLDDDKNFGIFF